MSELKRTVWGPALWSFLHTAAASADDPGAFVDLLSCLTKVLPCPECRTHLEEFYQARPPSSISDASSASRYVFELHNAVNARLGKASHHPRILHARHGIMLPDSLTLAASARRLRPYRLI